MTSALPGTVAATEVLSHSDVSMVGIVSSTGVDGVDGSRPCGVRFLNTDGFAAIPGGVSLEIEGTCEGTKPSCKSCPQENVPYFAQFRDDFKFNV